jgi:hypothetical protein
MSLAVPEIIAIVFAGTMAPAAGVVIVEVGADASADAVAGITPL